MLKRQHHIEVDIDLMQEGVAGFNSCGDRPLDEFSVDALRNHSYSFAHIPFKDESEIPVKIAFNYNVQDVSH